MSILKHIGFSAAAIGVVAGIPYLFNELQKLSIAENEAAQRQLDQLMFITVSPEFDVIEVSKQQAFIRGGSGNLDSEPRRVCRRLIWFSYAAMASVSRAA